MDISVLGMLSAINGRQKNICSMLMFYIKAYKHTFLFIRMRRFRDFSDTAHLLKLCMCVSTYKDSALQMLLLIYESLIWFKTITNRVLL